MTDAKLLKSRKITDTLFEPARHALPAPSEQYKQDPAYTDGVVVSRHLPNFLR
jgi:hypothetical protein